MPIRVQDELPAVNFLREENVFVMTASRATGQEIRPLKVLILNLMPKKIETENQFLRLLSNSPLQVDIQLLRIDARESRNTPAEHLNNFYCNFEDIRDENFDGLIVTGAPLGCLLATNQAGAGVGKRSRHVHLICLLGGTGRAEYPLWHSQANPQRQTFWRIRTPHSSPACAADAWFR